MDAELANWSGADGVSFAQGITLEATAPPEKRPLFRALPPAPAFPVEALGPLASAAIAIHQRTQAPVAIAAQSVLAAATLAVQAQRDVALPGGGQKPLTAIFVSVADSGERKSSVDRIALAAIHKVEDEWRQQAQRDAVAYVNAKAAWDAAREHTKRACKGDIAALRAAFDALGPEPRSPPHPMLLVADPTPEALTLHLADGRPMAGVFTAEGGLLIGGAAFNDESRMRTAALLNTLWDGEDRAKGRRDTLRTRTDRTGCARHGDRWCPPQGSVETETMKDDETPHRANSANSANELAPLAGLADGPASLARDANGRFLTGNSGGGRPKGSRNRLTEVFMSAVVDDFAEHGADAIERVRCGDPVAYLRIVGSFVPQELVLQREREPNVDIESLSFSDFMDLVKRLQHNKSIRRALLDAEG
jgi:hypothetical protein